MRGTGGDVCGDTCDAMYEEMWDMRGRVSDGSWFQKPLTTTKALFLDYIL